MLTVKIIPNDKGNPPGKLADAELHFIGTERAYDPSAPPADGCPIRPETDRVLHLGAADRERAECHISRASVLRER